MTQVQHNDVLVNDKWLVIWVVRQMAVMGKLPRRVIVLRPWPIVGIHEVNTAQISGFIGALNNMLQHASNF